MLVRRLVLPVLLTVVVLTAFAARAFARSPVAVVASNWKFTPATITVPAGEPTTLRLASSEGVHGIQSDALGLKQTVIVPGKFVEVTFTPSKAGTYPVHCSVMCGAGHADMVLTVEVK
ncbi:MAG TPA: cupredoxin domain-containing protein [Candidatus Dormibacteraeota bacterium]|nr:cupredoxin domain-containing protein [Candidatus Dormibacteraeota bacterium]